jgi:hypothetical protein
VWDLDTIGVPSKLRLIRKAAALARARPTLLLNCWEKATRRKWNWSRSVCGSWTPEDAKKRSVSRWACKNKSRTTNYSRLWQTCRLRGFTFTFRVRLMVQFLYQDDHVRYKNWTINHTLNVKVNPRRRHVCRHLL